MKRRYSYRPSLPIEVQRVQFLKFFNLVKQRYGFDKDLKYSGPVPLADLHNWQEVQTVLIDLKKSLPQSHWVCFSQVSPVHFMQITYDESHLVDALKIQDRIEVRELYKATNIANRSAGSRDLIRLSAVTSSERLQWLIKSRRKLSTDKVNEVYSVYRAKVESLMKTDAAEQDDQSMDWFVWTQIASLVA